MKKAARCVSIRAQRTSACYWATDGSVDLKGERMGTGFVVVENPWSDIILELAAPVSGPLATLRADAVGLLCLLQRVKSHFHHAVPLLVFC